MRDRNDILSFIKQRFPINCHWLDGNCYYFALILKDRFNGTIFYDQINCHFITKIDTKFYDWTGIIKPDIDKLLNWEELKEKDISYYNRLVRDCLF